MAEHSTRDNSVDCRSEDTEQRVAEGLQFVGEAGSVMFWHGFTTQMETLTPRALLAACHELMIVNSSN